jgi:hypothetical protein
MADVAAASIRIGKGTVALTMHVVPGMSTEDLGSFMLAAAALIQTGRGKEIEQLWGERHMEIRKVADGHFAVCPVPTN